MNAKQIAAENAVTYIQNGMTLGLGTGSTAAFAISKIGSMVKQGLTIRAIATSLKSEHLARECGIPIISFADIDKLDITIDGADECDEKLQLIKGGGGALLREKIVGAATKNYIIIVDEKKIVQRLGKFPLPVEVIPFGYERVVAQLISLSAKPTLRKDNKGIFITDNHNYIVDCDFGGIQHASSLNDKINSITGVVENGLFINMADIVIVGNEDGTINTLKQVNK